MRRNYMIAVGIVAVWGGIAFVVVNLVANTMQTWTARQHAPEASYEPPPPPTGHAAGYMRLKHPPDSDDDNN
jgi:hypothetical protein